MIEISSSTTLSPPRLDVDRPCGLAAQGDA